MLALMLFASCAQEGKYETLTEEETTQAQPQQIRFTTNSLVSAEVETRAAGVPEGQTLKAGDRIGIFVLMARDMKTGDTQIINNTQYGYHNIMGVVQEDGSIDVRRVTLYYPINQEDKVVIMAYAPYEPYKDLLPAEVGSFYTPQLTTTLKADQSLDVNYTASDLLIGLPEDGNPVRKNGEPVRLKFVHNGSRIKLALDIEAAKVAGYERVQVYVNQPLAGAVSALDGSVVTDGNSQQDILFADYRLADLPLNSGYYSANCSCLLLPNDYDEANLRVFTFKFTGEDVDDYVEVREDKNKVNHESGNSYKYHCTIGESVTPDHEDQDPDDDDDFELGIKERK